MPESIPRGPGEHRRANRHTSDGGNANPVRKGVCPRRETQEKTPPQQFGNLGRPTIHIKGGSLPEIVDEAERILIERDKEIFQRGDLLVRPARQMVDIADQRQTPAMRVVPVKPVHLAERLTRIIDFRKYDARSKKLAPIDCPPSVAVTYLERMGNWNLPILTGIVDAPTLRRDGSILDKPGYDERTGILYMQSEEFGSVPEFPTKQEAQQALDQLISLIARFPFVGKDGDDAVGKPSPSRSVALSAILTTLIRRSIPNAPLHAFNAPVMGSGKSKLVDIASMIAAGHEAPVIAQSKSEEEMEKRLGAALISGDALISFDNCEHPLGGNLLCQALTQRIVKTRILGQSVNMEVVANAMFAATGNNLQVLGDITRRTIIATLDPKVERPELREFPSDPVELIRAARRPYVLAALTVLRAYVVAGKPVQSIKRLGSFEDWSDWVRSALIWLGEADPCETMDDVRKEAPTTQALADVLYHWHEVIGIDDVPVKRAIDRAHICEAGQPETLKHPEFHTALMAVAAESGQISNLRLGNWLRKNKGRIVNGLRFEPSGTLSSSGGIRWKVQKC
jgi:putative DNA primase/helicase